MTDTALPKKKTPPAIWFLWIVVALVLTALGFYIWAGNNSQKILEIAFVPSEPFSVADLPEAPDYSRSEHWALLGNTGEELLFPSGIEARSADTGVDVFFIHPTTYLRKDGWNADLTDTDVNGRITRFVLKHQTNSLNAAGTLYMPRYRQATFGAFFDKTGSGPQAIFTAYGDILKAFDTYMADHNKGRPFILAGHSQGALHGLLLIKDRLSQPDIRAKLVAAYLIGWPMSVEADLAPFGFKPCDTAGETGCVISYQSYEEGGDPSALLTAFAALPGLGGSAHTGQTPICINPLDWTAGGTAEKELHTGALPLDTSAGSPIKDLIPTLTGASCGPDGILYVSSNLTNDWKEIQLPGGNLHPYDVNLFWNNVRENAAHRANAFLTQKAGTP